MKKLKELLAALMALMAIEAAKRDEKAIVAKLEEITGHIERDPAFAQADNEALRELKSEIAQLRKDVDAAYDAAKRRTVIASTTAPAQLMLPGQRMGFRFSSPELAKSWAQHCLDVRAIRNGHAPKFNKDLSANADETGGFAVPDGQIAAEISRGVEMVGVAGQIGREVPMGPGGFRQLRRLAGITMAWKLAGAAGSESSPTFGMLKLEPETLFGLVDLDMEFDEDALINLGNYLLTEAIYGIGAEEDRVAFVGTGIPADGGITGVLNSDRVTTVTMDAADDAFTDVDGDYLIDMETQCNEEAAAEAIYLVHRTVLGVLRKLKASDGSYLTWAPGGGGEAPTLNNYPYRTASKMRGTASSAASTTFLAFGDFRRGLMIGRRGQLRVDFSDHVLFKNGQRVWRFAERVDIAVNGYTAAEIAANAELSNPLVVLKTGAGGGA